MLFVRTKETKKWGKWRHCKNEWAITMTVAWVLTHSETHPTSKRNADVSIAFEHSEKILFSMLILSFSLRPSMVLTCMERLWTSFGNLWENLIVKKSVNETSTDTECKPHWRIWGRNKRGHFGNEKESICCIDIDSSNFVICESRYKLPH